MRKTGFTLVELLVVIAIISVLTLVTVGQFQSARKKANDTARKGDLNAVSKALLMYYTDYGILPEANSDGTIKITDANWGGTFEDTTVVPPYVYMKKLPKENNLSYPPYCYKVDSDRKKFALFAELESKTDKECDRDNDNKADDTYQCGGNKYCYWTTSPNTSLDTSGNIQ